MIRKYIGLIRIDFTDYFQTLNGFPGFSGNDRACTSSRYQAVSLPRGLGTRLGGQMVGVNGVGASWVPGLGGWMVGGILMLDLGCTSCSVVP